MRGRARSYDGDGRPQLTAISREALGLAARLDRDPVLIRGGAAVRLRVAAAIAAELAAIRAEMAARTTTTTTTTTR